MIFQLQTDYERLLPDLQQLAKEQAERKAREEESAGGGLTYAKEYAKISEAECVNFFRLHNVS